MRQRIFAVSYVTRLFAYTLAIWAFLAGAAVGWGNGELRARDHLAELARARDELGPEWFYRGVYVTCRLFGEGLFLQPDEVTRRDCLSMVGTAREKGLVDFLYWQLGYEPE